MEHDIIWKRLEAKKEGRTLGEEEVEAHYRRYRELCVGPDFVSAVQEMAKDGLVAIEDDPS